jgi:hypothetical protein
LNPSRFRGLVLSLLAMALHWCWLSPAMLLGVTTDRLNYYGIKMPATEKMAKGAGR